MTTDGPGTVLMVQMKPPRFRIGAALKVLLWERRGEHGYSGTWYPMAKIKRVIRS